MAAKMAAKYLLFHIFTHIMTIWALIFCVFFLTIFRFLVSRFPMQLFLAISKYKLNEIKIITADGNSHSSATNKYNIKSLWCCSHSSMFYHNIIIRLLLREIGVNNNTLWKFFSDLQKHWTRYLQICAFTCPCFARFIRTDDKQVFWNWFDALLG